METLICWNCAERTPPGTCIKCGAEVVSTIAVAEEMDNQENNYDRTIDIRGKGGKVYHLDLNQLTETVSDNFNVLKSVLVGTPKFLVEDPGQDFDLKFNKLLSDSSQILDGLTPIIRRTFRYPNQFIIQYAFFDPRNVIEPRKLKLLTFFTAVAIFLSGWYNYSFYSDSLDEAVNVQKILGMKFNFGAMIYAFSFMGVLFAILFLKDVIQNYIAKRYFDFKINSIFIPGPPIFEFGTLGSIAHQRVYHRTRKSMFYTSFLGQVTMWALSVLVFLVTLEWGTHDPEAVQEYHDGHTSYAQNGRLEPLIVRYIVELGNFLKITNVDINEPVTRVYLLHPVTLAALCAIYVIGLNFLPVTHLSGGYLTRAQFGQRMHGIVTYIAIFALVLFDLFFVSLVLLLAHRQLRTPEVLNEESNMGLITYFLYSIAILICILSFPIGMSFIY